MPPSGFLLNWQATEGYVNRQQTVAAQFGPLFHHNLIIRLPSDKVTDQILTRMLQACPPTAAGGRFDQKYTCQIAEHAYWSICRGISQPHNGHREHTPKRLRIVFLCPLPNTTTHCPPLSVLTCLDMGKQTEQPGT